MKILITAGGTSEKIDDVRKITNTATGRLGALTAEQFMKKAQAEITYVCGESAVVPFGLLKDKDGVKIIKIGSVEDLQNTLTGLLSQTRFDAVVHSMAVSDYSVLGTMSVDVLSSVIAEFVQKNRELVDNPKIMADSIRFEVLQNIESVTANGKNKKISSSIDNLMIFMDKTPKVINMIKRLQPETILGGFKLLSGVNEDELLRVGHRLLVANSCDFVIANDSERIGKDRHEAILIEQDCSFSRLDSKQKIAEAIADKIIAKIKERNL